MTKKGNNGDSAYHSEINLDELEPYIGLKGHVWQGRGTMQIVCTSCPYVHSHTLRPYERFWGIDKDGQPIIKKI